MHARNGQGKKPLDVAATPAIGALLRVTMAEKGQTADEEDYLDGDEADEGGESAADELGSEG